MFTGIIENVGRVSGVSEVSDAAGARARVFSIDTGFKDLALGESVAVNGACLTVTECRGSEAKFFVSEETLELTNLARLESGVHVNLERALTLNTRLSGHIVQGHVDGLAKFVGAEKIAHPNPEQESFRVRFELPAGLERYCVHKGSISLNGTSLTLNRVDGRIVEIMLIPHTWQHTNLSRLQPGDPVNVEVDLMAKYAEKLLAGRS